MQLSSNSWIISPRDLIAELECDQRVHLDWAVASQLLPAPEKEWSEQLKKLIKMGEAHESRVADDLRKSGSFIQFSHPGFDTDSLTKACAETKAAMSQGIETIAQATLFTGDYMGFADFLILCKDEDDNPVVDDDGRFVYDPVDAKSARSEKRSAILQVASYAHAMIALGLPRPHRVHLWLGGNRHWSTRADDVIDLAGEFIDRVHERLRGLTSIPEPLWAAPREACTRCRWQPQCESGRVAAQDLSLVQNIRSTTRTALVTSGIKNIDQLANARDDERPLPPKEVSRETFATLRSQASIQIRGRGFETPLWEVRDADALGLMPERSSGDIWFDMEGDPYAHDGDGLEYMFGYSCLSNAELQFNTFDALDRNEEKRAFTDFITFVLERRAQDPHMHIYHYAAYEPSAMLRLALRHGTYEFEVDALIREGVFVDLYSLIRKAFRFSTESLSIKHIEAVYQDKRDKKKGVNTAIDSVIAFENALDALRVGDRGTFDTIYREIKLYNKADCDSTFWLDSWIREQATNLGVDLAALRPVAIEKFSDPEEQPVEPIALQLIEEISPDPHDRSSVQNGLALLSGSISFHRREARPAWRAIFERANAELDDLENFNDVVVATEVSGESWSVTGKDRKLKREVNIEARGLDISQILSVGAEVQALYEVAPEGFQTIQGSTRGFNKCTIQRINDSRMTIKETEKSEGTWTALPMAILPPVPITTAIIQQVLRDELGATVLSMLPGALDPFPKSSWKDLLLKKPPQQLSGALTHSGNPVEDIISSLKDSDMSYVAVQGPPGTGKTTVGGEIIANLVKGGWRIGVVAQSHAVIENLLDRVAEIDPDLAIGKKAQKGTEVVKGYYRSDVSDWIAQLSTGFVVGGTVWSFSSSKLRSHHLDLMVIDEAGQFSLANALAVLSAADRALLLGDPQQLPQVSLASHPEPVEVSVLAHILGEHSTMPPHLGYFLDTTYRLHPKLAEPVSHLQYEGRLHAAPQCSLRTLEGIEPGLHIVNVDHEGNTVMSPEESDAIVEKITAILNAPWTDVAGGIVLPARPLLQEDILVVTAYNKQVRKIRNSLQEKGLDRIAVGTFDKFQGQEAPVVFVSMATSSSEDLPRGIDFLLSPNRLNVAISRAKWACFLYRSPQLSKMEPNSPQGMVQLGKFISLCRGTKATNQHGE